MLLTDKRETLSRLLLLLQVLVFTGTNVQIQTPELCFAAIRIRTPEARDALPYSASPSAQFPCFFGAKAQILTPSEPRRNFFLKKKLFCRNFTKKNLYKKKTPTNADTQT